MSLDVCLARPRSHVLVVVRHLVDAQNVFLQSISHLAVPSVAPIPSSSAAAVAASVLAAQSRPSANREQSLEAEEKGIDETVTFVPSDCVMPLDVIPVDEEQLLQVIRTYSHHGSGYGQSGAFQCDLHDVEQFVIDECVRNKPQIIVRLPAFEVCFLSTFPVCFPISLTFLSSKFPFSSSCASFCFLCCIVLFTFNLFC